MLPVNNGSFVKERSFGQENERATSCFGLRLTNWLHLVWAKVDRLRTVLNLALHKKSQKISFFFRLLGKGIEGDLWAWVCFFLASIFPRPNEWKKPESRRRADVCLRDLLRCVLSAKYTVRLASSSCFLFCFFAYFLTIVFQWDLDSGTVSGGKLAVTNVFLA